MSSDRLTKQNIFPFLKELAKEFRKRNKNLSHVELIIVGGASILLNYGFREMTSDIDAFSTADSSMKDAAAAVAGKFNLNPEWLNNDFLKAGSYSDKLRSVSKRYCLYNNGTFDIRTVKSEYLIAMKLNSDRRYKNDFSDIIGILKEEKSAGNDISSDKIFSAYSFLYGNSFPLTNELQENVKIICKMNSEQLEHLYQQTQQKEHNIRTELIKFDNSYKSALNKDNIDSIIEMLEKRI